MKWQSCPAFCAFSDFGQITNRFHILCFFHFLPLNFLHLVLFLKQQSSTAFCAFSAFCHSDKVTKSTAFSAFSAFCETAIKSCFLRFFSFWANYKQVSHFVLFLLFAILAKWPRVLHFLPLVLFVKQQSSPIFCAFSAFGGFVMETTLVTKQLLGNVFKTYQNGWILVEMLSFVLIVFSFFLKGKRISSIPFNFAGRY